MRQSAPATCLAEAAQDTRTLDRLDQRSFAVAELTQPLRLLDVSSDWSTRAGPEAQLSTAPRREPAGGWASNPVLRGALSWAAHITGVRLHGGATGSW